MTNHSAVEEKHSTYDDKKSEIALRAYQIWQEHGCTHGHDREDWHQSEQELHGHVH